MTEEQEQLITLLFIKFGGFREVVDTWLYADDKFSTAELDAVNAWLADEQTKKPNNVQLVKDAQYPYLAVEFTLDIEEKD